MLDYLRLLTLASTHNLPLNPSCKNRSILFEEGQTNQALVRLTVSAWSLSPWLHCILAGVYGQVSQRQQHTQRETVRFRCARNSLCNSYPGLRIFRHCTAHWNPPQSYIVRCSMSCNLPAPPSLTICPWPREIIRAPYFALLCLS